MNYKHLISSTLLVLFVVSGVIAQDDPVLFTVNNNPVHVSEFNYIYLKNNGDTADFSKSSLDEYLDLYKKFKLKVEKAKSIGLDTVQRLQSELEGYRKQLASSYLVDKEVSEKLVDEVVERQKTDVGVSHIFIATPPNASPESLLKAKEKVGNISTMLKQGKDFAELAKTESDDKASAIRGGDLGYYIAMLPDGFYEFENTMYELEVGEVSDPIKSKLGYHIIKVNDRRPSRGEIEASHILIKKFKNNVPVKAVKATIDSLRNYLGEGMSFEEVAKQFSQDKNTAEKGGYLGVFGINKYEKGFEDAAFALKPGEISDPIETKIGWHIIKKISIKEKPEEAKQKRRVQALLSKAGRFEIAKKKLIERISEDVGTSENKLSLTQFIASQDEGFYSYKWQVPENLTEELFTIGGNKKYIVQDFAQYCKKDTRSRLKFNKTAPLNESVNKMFDSFKDEKLLAYEEAQLPNKYPEFKSLMREYEEGILLFEATKIEVWDKASNDSIGLVKFHEMNSSDYTWDERIEVQSIHINTDDAKLAKTIHKALKKSDIESLVGKYNSESEQIITSETQIIEKSNDLASKYQGNTGHISSPKKEDTGFSFFKILNVMPTKEKTLKEARGYIIADYQDKLEKEWISSLKEEFEIELNEDVYNSLIKK